SGGGVGDQRGLARGAILAIGRGPELIVRVPAPVFPASGQGQHPDHPPAAHAAPLVRFADVTTSDQAWPQIPPRVRAPAPDSADRPPRRGGRSPAGPRAGPARPVPPEPRYRAVPPSSAGR